MDDEAMNPTVTLNANVDPYVQGMNQAAEATKQSGAAISGLLEKMHQLNQSAAQKFQIVGAGTLASLTALALAADGANKQLSTLQASAAITGKNFGAFRDSVASISSSMPRSRDEIAQLTTSISKLGITSQKQVDEFTRLFAKMGSATGGSPQVLADQMIKLSRTMGTLDTQSVTKFSNSLTYVSAKLGTSAEGAAQFANSIAPFTRAAEIGEAATLGLGAAFSKAGADGMVAANTFAGITSDITNSLASGSPEIKKFASVLGMTVKEFGEMDSAERVVKIFEKISTSGKSAGVILQQLGYEGPRTARQIQQAVAEAGGIRRAVGLADSGGENAIETGSKAAEDNISDQFIKIKNTSRATADALGEPLVGPLKAVARTMAAVSQAGTTMAQIFAPLLKIVVPLAAAFLALGTAMKVMGAMQGLATASGMTARGAMGGGLLAGMRSVTGAPQSAVGQMYAERMAPGFVPGPGQRQLTAYERGMYTAGRGVGNLREMLSSGGAARGLFQTGAIGTLKGVQLWNNWSSDFAQQMGQAGPQRTWTPLQSLINKVAPDSRFATANLGPQPVPATAPGAATAPMASAPGFFGQARTWLNSTPEERAARKAGLKIGKEEFRGLQDINERFMSQTEQLKSEFTGKELKKKLKELEKATIKEINDLKDSASKQLAKATKTVKEAGSVSAEAGRAIGSMGKNFGTWAKVAYEDLKGLTSMAAKVLSTPVRMFGGPMIAITAGLVAWQQIKKAKDEDKKLTETYAGQSGLKDFYAAIGQTSPNQTSLQDVLKSQEKVVAKNTKYAQAIDITGPEYKQASVTGRKMTDSRFRKMSDQQILAYLRINNLDLKSNPVLLSQVANDIIQATGSGKRAQDILTAYDNGASTPGGIPQSSNAASGASPIQGAATEADYRARAQFYQKEAQGGWFTRNLGIGGAPEGLVAAISQDTTAAQNTAGALQNIYGSDTGQKTNIGAATAAMATNATISALPNFKDQYARPGKIPTALSWVANGGWGRDDANTQRIWSQQIRTLEKQFGIDPVGFSYADFMSWSTKNDMDIRDPSQVNAALYKYLNTKGDRGKALATAMYGGEGQYAGKTAAQIQRSLSDDISNFNPTKNSATKKQMDTVTKMTGNKSGGGIYAETLAPTADGGMSTFAKSLSQTGNEELKYAAGLEQATAAIKASNGDIQKAIATLGELAYNAGPGTQEAAIYRSAQTAAGFQAQTRTMEISPIQNLRETVSNARNTLNTSMDPAALTAAKDATVQVESTFRQILLSIINFNKSMARAEEDYLKQRGYAIEDFKKQKKYQIEDAAKTINNPYQPLQAQSVIGGAALLQNYTRGTNRIADHLENLKKLEKLGLSRSTIQQLDLINPANFQETVVLIDYLKSNPSKVDQFNKQTENRIKNTSTLMNSGFVEAFRRADESFKTGMTRMEDSYNKTMSRAKTDFNDTMNGMTGNLETLFQKATSKASAGIKALGAEAKNNLQSVFEDIYQVKVIVSKGGDTPKKTPGQAQAPTLKPVPTSSAPGARNPGAKGYADDPKNSGTVDSITNTSPVASYGFRNPPSPDWVKDNWMSLRSPSQPPKGENRDNGKWAYLGSRGNGTDWIWFDYDSFPQGAFDQKDGNGKPLQTPIQRAYGGQVDAGRSYVVGEKGPELLQGVSGHIMPSSSFQTSVARETVQMMRVAGFANQTTYKGGGVTNVDNSTKIMGGQFTVVTNDPDAMGRQLKGKERLDRLRTGKRTP